MYTTGITKPTIHQLTEELLDMNDWYSLGVFLLVPVSKLQEIMTMSSQGGTARWRIDLLQYWLDSTPTASWSDIITALEKIGHRTLSSNLRLKYLLSTTTITGMRVYVVLLCWYVCVVIVVEQQLSTTITMVTSSVTMCTSATHPATTTTTSTSTSVDVQPSTPGF